MSGIGENCESEKAEAEIFLLLLVRLGKAARVERENLLFRSFVDLTNRHSCTIATRPFY